MTQSPAQRSAATEAMLAAAAGDVAAFGRVIDLLGSRVFGLVHALVDDRATAATLTRELLVEAWREAPQFRATDHTADTWLLSRAHRGTVAWLRESEESPTPLEVDPSTLLTTSAGIPTVREAVAALDELEREVLASAYFAGRTCDDVARDLGVPVTTVREVLRRALHRLGPRLLRPTGLGAGRGGHGA